MNKKIVVIIVILLLATTFYYFNQNSNFQPELPNENTGNNETSPYPPNIIIGGGDPEANTISPTTSPINNDPLFKVYFDQLLTNPVENINWGTLYPGDTTNVTVYIKNIYDAPMTLALTSTDVTPEKAENYLILSLSYASPINPEDTCPLTLSLYVEKSVEDGITDFSITFTLTATF